MNDELYTYGNCLFGTNVLPLPHSCILTFSSSLGICGNAHMTKDLPRLQ